MSSYAESESGGWGFLTILLILAAIITIGYIFSLQPAGDTYYSPGQTDMEKCKVCGLYSADLYEGKCPNCRNYEQHKPRKGAMR